jgi:hypothetical protein
MDRPQPWRTALVRALLAGVIAVATVALLNSLMSKDADSPLRPPVTWYKF